MNVLITGNLSSLTTTLVKAFQKEDLKVILVNNYDKDLKVRFPKTTCHTLSPSDDNFQEIVSAYRFDVAVYLATREEHLLRDRAQSGSQHSTMGSGQALDGFLSTLEVCKNKDVKKIYLITSSEVYGDQEGALEHEDPQPASPNGFTLKTAEQYCQYYNEKYGLSSTIVRIPYIYSKDEPNSLLHDLIKSGLNKKVVTFPSSQEKVCSFLHAEDVADYILRSIDDFYPGVQKINLSSSDPISFGELAQLLEDHLSEARFVYGEPNAIFTRPTDMANAKKMNDWIPEHKLAEALPGMVDAARVELTPKVSFFQKLSRKYPRYPIYLKWLELFLGAALMTYLTNLSGSLIEFRYVDFRLIYVVLMGYVYGTQMGLFAAVLASISLVVGWGQMGFDWTELLYNTATWMPFAVYFTAGGLTGFLQDKKENSIRFQNEQNNLIQEKYRFLYELYEEVCQIKNQFYKQLVGSRDSFGRIFQITRELDTLEEEEILFKALTILEDVMDNQSIAIYSINQAKGFARLETYSSALKGQIGKSLNLPDYPHLVESMQKGEIFQNNLMHPDYPAYFAPIQNGDAAVVIWNASFEQFSLYYFNLFKVICGLIESSIHRVALFMNANSDNLYYPYTRILFPEPFKKVLRIKSKMKKNKVGEFLVAAVSPDGSKDRRPDWEQLYAQIAPAIRAEDYVGVLDDGNCYILFSQAEHTNASVIFERFDRQGICLEPIDDLAIASLTSLTVMPLSKEFTVEGPIPYVPPQRLNGRADPYLRVQKLMTELKGF